jgi:hypothetical protein
MAERLSILQNFRSSLVVRDPFPHFVIDNALPGDVYEALDRQYPSPELIFANQSRNRPEKQMLSNRRYDISAATVHANPALDLGLWRDFVLYHSSQDFLDEILDKLGEFIALRHDWLLPKLLEKAPGGKPRAGVRRHNDSAAACEVALDCQVGMNSPVKEPSAVKGLHLDDGVELFAGLFYVRDKHDDTPGGDLQIYRWTTAAPSFHEKRNVRPEHAELVGSVPYGANRFALLLNDIDAIHGVSPRPITVHPRRLVNIIAEVYPTVERLFDERPYQEKTSVFGKLLARAGLAS